MSKEVTLSLQSILALVGIMLIVVSAFMLMQFEYRTYGILLIMLGVMLLAFGIPQKKND